MKKFLPYCYRLFAGLKLVADIFILYSAKQLEREYHLVMSVDYGDCSSFSDTERESIDNQYKGKCN